jgi:hypothetical protein
MAQQHKVGSVHTAIQRSRDGVTRVVYHSTSVVEIAPDGSVTLDSGGWRTPTTKTRMNQAANQFSLGFQVYARDGEWFVLFSGHNLPFFDGMTLNQKAIDDHLFDAGVKAGQAAFRSDR